ncbi:MAG: hypothetical protein LBJ96_03680 [Holosporaceae bacterium]|nr:hypothetical protein [Holosporaceae bacterium]
MQQVRNTLKNNEVDINFWLPYKGYSESDFIEKAISTNHNVMVGKNVTHIKGVLGQVRDQIRLEFIRAQQFHARINDALSNVDLRPGEPANDGIRFADFPAFQVAVRSIMEGDPLQFMERCKEDPGTILDQLPPGLPDSVKAQITGMIRPIIDAYQANTGLPPLPPPITVYVGQATVDLERHYRFLSRVVGVIDGMLGNAKFAKYDLIQKKLTMPKGMPQRFIGALEIGTFEKGPHINFTQYRIIRDAVKETLTKIHGTTLSNFFENQGEFLKPLTDLIEVAEAGKDGEDSIKSKLEEIYEKIIKIINDFGDPKNSDSVPQNIPFFVVEKGDNDKESQPASVDPLELANFLDPEEVERRKIRIKNLRICINEIYFAVQVMRIEDRSILDLFGELTLWASSFLGIDIEEICNNLKNIDDRVSYIEKAIRFKINERVNAAMDALVYYKKFEESVLAIRDQCSNLVGGNGSKASGRAAPHCRVWCGFLPEIIKGTPLTELVNQENPQWPSSKKDGKGLILDGGIFVKVIWPPYEYISARPSATGIPLSAIKSAPREDSAVLREPAPPPKPASRKPAKQGRK